ncbi:MAG TPA: hypothetical protein VN031_02590 [Candidatus Microsaccharimonas sp.]|nr:hypothetical protein [Candidatus Microsaccharimonas sp.]
MRKTHIRQTLVRVATIALVFVGLSMVTIPELTFAAGGVDTTKTTLGTKYCGDPSKNAVTTSIDIGCKGKGNPIMDMLFAFIRFLSYGVGLVIVASLTYAGIQYTGSRGDPSANAQAVKRIQANVSALLLFVFAYAIINYIIPGAVLH